MYVARMAYAAAIAQSVVSSPRDINSKMEKKGGLAMWQGVLFISIMEMLGCSLGTAVYFYAAALEPSWAGSLVPFPEIFTTSVNIVQGCLNVIGLLFLLEFFQAVCLFKGAVYESLGLARFWLYSKLSCVISVSIVVLGMILGEVCSPTMTFVGVLNVVVRFMEFAIVHAWTEDVVRSRCGSNERRGNGRYMGRDAVSTTTIPSSDNEPATPPPTVSSSASTTSSVTLRDVDEILPVPDEEEFARTNLWRQQWA